MGKQYDCVDAAKLILSLFVVAIHTKPFHSALFPVARLAVPVFFIFTGFFSFVKIGSTPLSQQKKTLWDIEKRYLKLYLFWFIVLLPFTLHTRQYHTYHFLDFAAVFIRDLLWGSTFQASWYLMACVLGIAIVFYLSKASQLLLVSMGISFYFLATCVSKYHLIITDNSTLNLLYSVTSRLTGSPYNNVCIAIPYIIIGKMIAEEKFRHFRQAHSILGFLICYLALLCEFYLAKHHSWFCYHCDCWFMLAPTAIFFVLSVLSLNIRIPKHGIMRSMSTVIYCSHLAIVTVVTKGLSVCKIADKQNVLLFTLTVICAVVLSLVIFRLEKISKLQFLKHSH